jgi:transposase
LQRGGIVVIDNPGSRKRAAINKAISAKGARRFFPPQNSPDLNPIEQVFAKLKKLPRKAEERTPEGVCRQPRRSTRQSCGRDFVQSAVWRHDR